jgi:hypothetical protein
MGIFLSGRLSPFFALAVRIQDTYVYVDNDTLNYFDFAGLSKGGWQNIKPSDFPERLPGESDREWALRAEKILRARMPWMSEAAIRAWRAFIKVLKRASIFLIFWEFYSIPNTAHAGEVPVLPPLGAPPEDCIAYCDAFGSRERSGWSDCYRRCREKTKSPCEFGGFGID